MQTISRKWILWKALPMAAYVIVLLGTRMLLAGAAGSWWAVPLALAPLLPILVVVWGGIRALGEMDELERRIALEGNTFAQTVLIVLAIGYGFLQAAVGLPAINCVWFALALIALSATGRRLAQRNYR